MEQLSSCITDRMIALDIINRDDKDCYCYSVQGILEKITCLSLIVICASIFQSLIEILAFLSIFMLIRRSSDGIHCKTTIGCFCASTMMSLSTVLVANAMNCATCIGGVLCSMVVLCIVATFNNSNLNLTEDELNHLKRRSRYTSMIAGGIVVILILLFSEKKIVFYFALGVIYNAISILIAIIFERRNQRVGKEET